MTWNKWTVISTITLLIVLGCGQSQAPAEEKSYSSEQLKDVIDSFLENEPGVLGTVVRVDIQDRESYKVASGYFDRSRKAPIKKNDQFIIGSITKVFTAVLVLQLVKEGKVQLQEPLISYLSSDMAAVLTEVEFGNDITVEHALSHRTGLYDVTGDERFLNDNFGAKSKRWTPLELLKLLQQEGEPKFKPGQGHDYCNINYTLLGSLIENVLGQSYKTALQNRIFDKIGLKSTFLSEGTFGSGAKGIMHGYFGVGDEIYDGQDIPVEWAQASGGIISTVDDLIRFYGALEEGVLFESRQTYEQMYTLVGNNDSYGLGLKAMTDSDLGLFYGHGGNFGGSRSILVHFPEHEITITVCHTFENRQFLQPMELMKAIIRDILNLESMLDDDADFETGGPFLLAEQANVIVNEDVPLRGEWDLQPKEIWNLSGRGTFSLQMPGKISVDDDGRIYLLAIESGEVTILGPEGDVLYSFGGSGDGPQFQFATELYLSSETVHVLDIRDKGDKIKSFDLEGKYLGAFEVRPGESPRVFADKDKFVAVRTKADVLNRPEYDRLELISMNLDERVLMGLFAAEEKLIGTADALRGRCMVQIDDIEIFPSLITHLDDDMLFVGRSDSYLIEKIDLRGKVKLAFSIKDRQRRPLPLNYGKDKIDRMKQMCGVDVPAETREQLVAGYPQTHVHFTDITTDEQGLIYVFVPDITDKNKQEVDIFSPDGEYIYRSIIEFPDALKRLKPYVIKGGYLYSLAETHDGDRKIFKYEIDMPIK